MANKSQLKAVGEQDFSESDPFAELTRIMGFDPRVQPTPRPEDDFQIDLEKELMGEFGSPDEHEDAHRQVGPAAELHREASPAEAVQPGKEADPYQPADDLEDALTSVFQQELGEESDAYASSAAATDEVASVPQGQERAGVAEEPRLPSVTSDAEADGFDDASSVLDSVSSEMEVEDRGPELADSLNQLLSNAGYKSGSSYSGTAQVYQISGSYVTAPPAAEAPAAPSISNESGADELATAVAENSAEAQPSVRHHSTVFGTKLPEWDVGVANTSEPAASDGRSAFDAPFDEMEASAGARSEPADTFAQPTSFEPDQPEEPEDPFAALAALGSEPPVRSFGEGTPVSPPAPVSTHPSGESRRFDGAARFYSSPDLFSRATPVAPGMRQPPRVPTPAPLPEQQMSEPAEEAIFAGEEEISFADPVQAREGGLDFVGADDAYGEIPGDAPGTEMRGETALPEEDEARSIAPQANAPRSNLIGERSSAAPASMPEIETIDVPEPAIAIADDLDIPTPPVEETPPPAPAFDDLDQEFVTAFSDLRHKEAKAAAAQPALSNEDEELTAKIEELFSAEDFDFSEHESPTRAAAAMPAMAANPAAQTRAPAQGAYGPETYAFQDEYYDAAAAASAYNDTPEETPAYPPSRTLAVHRKRRALVVDVAIGCAFVAIAIGAYAYAHHSTKDSGPVLLKADAQPVKMKPKHPGGTTVPNQNNQVYKRVADGDVAQPVEQQKLVSSEEKPVDLSAQASNGAASGASASTLPGVDVAKIPQASSQEIAALAKSDAGQPQKNQDRVAPSHATGADTSRADDVIAVEPRKVRTMIVKPDGTMVPTPLPAATPTEAPKSVATAALEEPAVKAAAGAKSASAAEHLQKPENRAVVTPQHVDVAPSRPAAQPVSARETNRNELAGNEKVAALEATPAHPAASGGWAMQIASQPTAQAAQTSYQHLAHRYGSVLGGHGVDIVKAEISGKGTYYRVRVPTSTRDEAIALCTKYKAAGGNCFVSK